MRVEPHVVDSIMHVVKRGARGMPIVRDEADRKRFVKLLFYANDDYRDPFWEQQITGLPEFERPKHWPEPRPLVRVLAWALLPNHFHLILKEVREGGIAKFMQQIGGSMTTHFNAKYKERGSIFQGSYRGRTADIHGDEYLRYLAVYVMVKNPFEMYQGGLVSAIKNFDRAYDWASTYPFCSLAQYAGRKNSPIVEKDILAELFGATDFRVFARECMEYKLDQITAFD